MDSFRIHDKFRICPTTQQGGTQTIQQSIYLTHNNPCGANLLAFERMGYTGIRYIDLKRYLDETLATEAMKVLFEELRARGTEYIQNPNNNTLYLKYLLALSNWASAGFSNIPIPPNYYPGYYMKFSVYDASGAAVFDSDFPFIKIVSQQGANLVKTTVRLYTPNPFTPQSTAEVYKICNNYAIMPWISEFKYVDSNINFYIRYSDFFANQVALPESIMATASLLLDTANTRSFGIPLYGFSDRVDILFNGGIGYNCCQFINLYTVPDADGKTTLIESFFARLTIYEDASIIPVA